MKKLITYGAPGILILLLATAAVSPALKPVAPYEREQTRGNLRVVLLKVERATIFTSQNIKDAVPGKLYPVSTIGVTYMAEALGDEPITNWNNFSGNQYEDITIGKRHFGNIDSLPENVIPGSLGIHSPASHAGNAVELPKSYNEKRSVVEEEITRSEPAPSGAMSLKFTIGFNGHSETFNFDNIPVN